MKYIFILPMAFVALLTMLLAAPSVEAQASSVSIIKNAQSKQKSQRMSVGLQRKSDSLSGNVTTRNKARISGNDLTTMTQTLDGDDQTLIVDILVQGSADLAAQAFSQLGLEDITVNDQLVSGRIALSLLESLSSHPSIKHIREFRPYTHRGAVTSQGIVAMRSLGLGYLHDGDGTGIRIGVMSDSFNCHGGEQADIASGDLPDNVIVLQEMTDCINASDEGRALIQIIYDIAKGAEFIFASGYVGGSAGTAETVLELAEKYRVDIIVDDIASYGAGFFQDDLMTQAVDQVVGMGVSYITAAGNAGNNSYEDLYRGLYDPVLDVRAHDFDPSEGVAVQQAISIPADASLSLIMQWDDPMYSISGGAGALSDMDIFLLNEAGTEVVASAALDNLGKDPIEVLDFYNPEGSQDTRFNLMIVHAGGQEPRLIKYVLPVKFIGSIDAFHTQSSTIIGHANAEGAISVGATLYSRTERFDYARDEVESFSSVGGTPLLFDIFGNRFGTASSIRMKPDITAPNGVNTTFYPGEDLDGDGLPNFRGTSAAAPHVAGIVALMREAVPNISPRQIQLVLQNTARDIQSSDQQSLPAGFDLHSGYGLILGWKAMRDAEALNLSDPVPPHQSLPYDYASWMHNDDTTQTPLVRSTSGGGSIYLFNLLLVMLLFSRLRTNR